MDFEYPPKVLARCQQLEAFVERYLRPYNAAWHQAMAQGIYPPTFVEDLKALARSEGVWNRFLPGLRDDEPGVASSDPTNLQTTMRREGEQLVLNGRKWFITGAAHRDCKLLIVMCRSCADDSD